MKQYGILGWPLGHTMSPLLHQLLAEQVGTELKYEKWEVSPEELPNAVEQKKGLDGFNVTIPHKVSIIPYLDRLDESARKHGAVNVVAQQQGEYVGYNTDCIGFVRSMEQEGVALAGNVCIVGMGGVGRMFATECAYRGCKLTLAVKREQIVQMEQDIATGRRTTLGFLRDELRWLSGHTVHIVTPEELTGNFDLLINATPVGMFPKTEDSPVKAQVLENVKTVFDCIYNPRETQLMAQARAAGCHVLGGLPMLVWQAAAAQEIWLGVRFTKEQIAQVTAQLEAAMREAEQRG